MSGDSTSQPNIALAVMLTWLLVAAQFLWLDWAQTAAVLGDSDDAMRLVEVRAFLSERGWFDLHEPRLQPPAGYDTHWSRLVDAGLAGLFLLFRTFADAAMAERLMRAIWPLLWIGPAIAGAVAIAWRLGGRPASLVVLLLLLLGFPAFLQFKPGRIDHHDIQITLALLAVAAAVWADRVQWAPAAAGGLFGLALAVGFEGMPFQVLVGAAFVGGYLFDGNRERALAHYGLGVAASCVVAFLVSVGADHWTRTACDAIAANSAAAAIIGGLGVAAAGHWFAHDLRRVRWTAIIIAIGLAVVAFALIEPRCLRGPLAMVDADVRAVWLAHVKEAQSLVTVIGTSLATGLGVIAFPAAALASMIMLASDAQTRSERGLAIAGAALIVAVAMTIVAVRASPYAIWFGMPLVATALVRAFDLWKLNYLPLRALAVVVFTPAVLSFGAIALAETIRPNTAGLDEQRDQACFESKNYAPLAKLPSGLVVSDVDYGPFLLALTSHSVLGAPYHRLSYGIVASHRVFAAPPQEAREILREARAAYLITCGARGPKGLSAAAQDKSLWTQLTSGAVPDWLEPVQVAGPFRVYRITPSKS